ncbi:MAG: PKD domain-containing protein [Bacteroidetes bacterium]|nr:PKD domain-containing protein [Bacteroidota bacterium]
MTRTVENRLRRKAIVVIGELLPGVEQTAALIYNALSFQGYSDEDIYLMTPDSIPNIEGITPVQPTLNNLNYAISEWAADNTWDVVIQFIGNGDKEYFHINPNENEMLSAINLDNWLDNLQNNISGPVTVIYDVCHSENFLSKITPSYDKKRILIGSTGEDQSANIIFNGEVSFSNFFWTGVFNGGTVKNSFVNAKNGIKSYSQTSYLDANGNGIHEVPEDPDTLGDYTIGLGIMQAGEKPVIEDVSPGQYIKSQTSAAIWADVTGDIDNVWAVIVSQPDLEEFQCIITAPPRIKLVYNPDTKRYEGTYDDFSVNGKYDISIYAQISVQNKIIKSLPKHTWVKQQCLNPIIVTKFSAFPTTGKEPLSVSFTDESKVSLTDELEVCNDIVNWYWEFGDATSTEKNPSHTYLNNGTYTVKLTITDAIGNTGSETITITINDTDPIAKASASPINDDEPLAVQFTGNSQSYDGITSWHWNFGDGATSTKQNPIHTYTQDGVYTAKLTVKEADSDIATASVIITVNDTDPIAIVSASPTSGNEPLTVNFTDHSQSYDGIVSRHWDFGDGTTSTEQNPPHTYTQDGSYTVILTVKEADGDESSAKIDIKVIHVDCTEPSFSSNEGKEPLIIDFAVSSCPNNNIASWHWDFGDGKTGTDQTPQHTYTQNGIYTVKLTATEADGDTVTADITITVNDTPPYNTKISAPTTKGDEPFNTTFTGYSESYDGITSWEWDFGDGTPTVRGQNTSHNYTQNGIYTVKLTVKEADRDTATATITITAEDIPPGPTEILAVPINEKKEEPLTVNFKGTSQSYDGIISWEWDFGNGHTSSGRNVTHTYIKDGVYTAKLTVKEADGGTDSGTVKIIVEDIPPGPTEISASETKGKEPLNVTFTGDSKSYDGIKFWHWDFGDGTPTVKSRYNIISHKYTESKTYTATLTVEEEDEGTDTENITITVEDTEPQANFSISLANSEELINMNFTDTSISHDSITSWHWDFGDGETSTEQNPTHIYNHGIYTAILTVKEPDNDEDSHSMEINTTLPIISTSIDYDSITSESVTRGGNVELVEGSEPVTSRGICWSSTTQTPTIKDNKGIIHEIPGTGSFTSSITGLACGTTYYVRAYAGNIMGTAYGDTIKFGTNLEPPKVTTAAIHSVTTRTASGGGDVISNGGSQIFFRGVCWNTTGNPTVKYSNNYTTDSTGTGNFESFITGLSHDTTYYVKAYAENAIYISYGPEVTFVTESPELPEVTTAKSEYITATTATSGGTVDSDGGAIVTERGVCWSTAENPTIEDDHTSDSTGTGNFKSLITGLSPDTIHYIRAYAINAAGIKYGLQESLFTKECNYPTAETLEINSITTTTASVISEIFSDGGCPLIAKGICWNTSGVPMIEGDDNRTYDGKETGNYTSIIKKLIPGTTYYVRAYATNVEKTAYGIGKEFSTLSMCDIDGNGNVDLNDAALVLKILAGMDVSDQIRTDYTESAVDINRDHRIGIEEIVYILQKVAELK